jgi:ribonuclease P protein component
MIARADGSKSQALSRASRVRRRPEFQHAYDSGIRLHGKYMAVFIVPNSGSGSRFGVAASRKLGGAVLRNRMKRLAREVFRRNKIAEGLDIIVVARREMLDASFSSLETDYRNLLARRHRPASGRNRHVPGGVRRARPVARV